MARPVRTSLSAPPAVAVCIDTRDGAGRKRLHGVMQYGRQQGWRILLVRRGGRAAAAEVARARPAGIIAYIADRPLAQVARRLRVPLVDTALSEVKVRYTVSLDNDAVGRLAAEHLLQAGLRNFGYCGVRTKVASGLRRDSFADHLKARGGHRLQTFSQTVAEGESQIEPLMRWLVGLPRPAGVLCFDDKLGERVLTACRWAKLAVPDQIAVLGVGDDELMCEVSWPTLSSICSPTQRLGFEAAQVLDDAMNRRPIDRPCRRVVPTGIAARGSTDTVATADPLIGSAVRFIRQHAGEAIGVDDVARALAISRRTLDRRFARVTGRTVHEELLAAKMRIARRLLADTAQPVMAIAQACGYATAASFSRSFFQHTGCWPTEYREQSRTL